MASDRPMAEVIDTLFCKFSLQVSPEMGSL